MRLGVIADDFSGATDIAGSLVENGMRVIQFNGVPTEPACVEADAVGADAMVVSLKSRSCAASEALAQSLAALRYLQAQRCQQFYFKYCSTFDSTAQGNIGPVTDALLDALNEDFTIVCPASPANGRTVFNGHLFVAGKLLNESGMRNHPVTPMTDSSLIRLMNAQSRGNTGLVDYRVVGRGAAAIEARVSELKAQGNRYAVVDAIDSSHLRNLGQAVKAFKMVTGAAGLAAGIAQNQAQNLGGKSDENPAGLPRRAQTVALSGSCSVMTNKQVAAYRQKAPYFALEVESCLQVMDTYVEQVCAWVAAHLDGGLAPLVSATAGPQKLQAIQRQYGAKVSSQAVEMFFSRLAQRLREAGVRNFIVAGGETSGTVVQSLQIKGFHIGPSIAPGVPWVRSIDGALSLALKSGNFGDEQFFEKAQRFYV